MYNMKNKYTFSDLVKIIFNSVIECDRQELVVQK